jgi:hypothetical protein
MIFTEHTQEILKDIAAISPRPLTFAEEMGILIDTAFSAQLEPSLDELSFQAKFANKTFGIMRRIGKDANGYDKLEKEFAASVERGKVLLQKISDHASADMGTRIVSGFLTLTPESFDRLMTLFRDLSWYKNYRIDSGSS